MRRDFRLARKSRVAHYQDVCAFFRRWRRWTSRGNRRKKKALFDEREAEVQVAVGDAAEIDELLKSLGKVVAQWRRLRSQGKLFPCRNSV